MSIRISSPSKNNTNDVKELFVSLQAGYELNINPLESNYLPENSFLFFYGSFSKQGIKSRVSLHQEILLDSFSLGINQQLNSYQGVTLGALGSTASVFLNQIEIGLNYTFEIESKKITATPYNYFEIFIAFDFSKKLGKFHKGNNARFSNF